MIFNNATIITMNPIREIISRGAVVIEGKKITAVGKSSEIIGLFPEEERIDCNGNILMPGLINTHVHTAQAMLRGCADNVSLYEFLVKRVWALLGNYTEEDGRASAALCALEMIKSGTTSFIECLLAGRHGIDGVTEIIIQSGMRAAIGKIVMDSPSYGYGESPMYPGMVEDGETTIRETIAAFDRWNGAGEGRIQVWFGARSPGGVSPECYDRISALARKRNMGITIHLCEVESDLQYAKSLGFRSPIDYANCRGLLGERTVVGHGVWTDQEDWRLMVETGTHVAHNPASNSKLASGIAPVAGMLQAGVNVALGTDAATCDNTYDLIRDLRLASLLSSLREDDPVALPAETVLEMATLHGARAMGIEEEVGSIESGKRADFIIINMDAPHLTPAWDPVSTIVYAAHGSDVDTVVIDGTVVMRNREVLTLDERMIIEDIRERHQTIARRSNLSIGSRWPVV